ncbi:MAG: FAD binding domain-containing protein [Thermodesulfobacteriota bacterium]
MRLESSLVWPKRLHWEKYFRPRTIPEALKILEEFQGKARLLAGGTDLIPQIRNRETEPKVLVDITRIPGLGEIKLEEGVIKIGALVTHTQVAESSLISEKALALSEGASQLGSPQIRNLGTVAGNIVSGQPGADTTIPLLALDAKVKIASKQGERTLPLTEFFLDTGKTVVDSSREMVVEIFFSPLAENESSVSLRLARRKALALPILTVSVVVSADIKQQKFNRIRIALGPAASIPFRPREAEQMLASTSIADTLIKEAARKAAQEANPRTSLLRGSEAYRRDIVANLVERGIRKAIERLEVKHG